VNAESKRLLKKAILKRVLSHYSSTSMLCGSLSPRHGASSGCGWRRRSPNRECVTENILKTVADSRKWVILLLGGGVGEGLTTPHNK